MACGSVNVCHKSGAYYGSNVIQLHSFFRCFGNSLHSHGIVTKHLFPDFTCSRPLLVFEMVKQVELSSTRCVVKGSHECHFKKRGECENAFKVTNDRWELGHVQIELDNLVLLGPYTERLLCKFEKKVIEICR